MTLKLTIHRGAKEIGGTWGELKTETTRVLIDAGDPLILNGEPIDDLIDRLVPHKKAPRCEMLLSRLLG